MAKVEIAGAREKITAALKEYVKKHPVVKRNDLFKPAIDSLKLSTEQQKDKSSDGVFCMARSIAGSIINELISAGVFQIKTDEPQLVPQPKVAIVKETSAERKKAILDYLTADSEKQEKEKTSKINILKSILNDKNNIKSVFDLPLSEAIDFVESKFIKAAKVGKTETKTTNGQKIDFPNTAVGTLIRSLYEKYQKFLLSQISQIDYQKAIMTTAISVIKENGGAFFEKLSLDLVKAMYGDHVIKDSDKITGGSNDRGIDAELKIVDEAGFEEKVVIQSKLSECGEKTIRELFQVCLLPILNHNL